MSAPSTCIDCQLAISDIWLLYTLYKHVSGTSGRVLNKNRLINKCCHKHAMRYINVLTHIGYEVINDFPIDKDLIVQTWEGLQKK